MIIRVDPDFLIQSSGNVLGVGTNVNDTGQCVLNSTQHAPSYDGQFGPRVQAIGAQAYSQAQGLTSQVNDHASMLQGRAQAFETADIAGVSGFENDIFTSGTLPDTSLIFNNLPVGTYSYFNLGNLTDSSNPSAQLRTDQNSKGIDLPKVGSSLIDITDSGKFIPWAAVGRSFNGAIGNVHGGWVGNMEGVGKAMPAIGFVLGVGGNVEKGDNLGRAIGSEAVEYALPYVVGGVIGGILGGVFGVGAGAIPGAIAGAEIGEEIYEGYKLAMGAAYIFSVGEQLTGNEQESDELQNTLDNLDFGNTISHEIYDDISGSINEIDSEINPSMTEEI